MRGYKLLAAYAAILLPLTGLFAEVTVKVQAPPANELKFDDLWSVALSNSSKTTFTVRLKAELSGVAADNSLDPIARAISNSIKLDPGTKNITRVDITQLADTWYKSGYEDLLKNGTLPTGAYQIEITVLTAKNDEMAWDHVIASIAPPSPPHLVSPSDGTALMMAAPSLEWSAPAPLAPGIEPIYHLKIVETQAGQTAQDALSSPAWYDSTGISGTTFAYPSDAKPLVAGANYLWQVTAAAGGADLGASEAWNFSLAPQVGQVDIGHDDVAAALQLTSHQKVILQVQDALAKIDNAQQAINRKDAATALKGEKDALKALTAIVNQSGKTKESKDFVDRLHSASAKLTAQINSTSPWK
jgi:hypothetical protein